MLVFTGFVVVEYTMLPEMQKKTVTISEEGITRD